MNVSCRIKIYGLTLTLCAASIAAFMSKKTKSSSSPWHTSVPAIDPPISVFVNPRLPNGSLRSSSSNLISNGNQESKDKNPVHWWPTVAEVLGEEHKVANWSSKSEKLQLLVYIIKYQIKISSFLCFFSWVKVIDGYETRLWTKVVIRESKREEGRGEIRWRRRRIS